MEILFERNLYDISGTNKIQKLCQALTMAEHEWDRAAWFIAAKSKQPAVNV